MSFSIASLGEEPGRRFVELVKLCELLGFDGFTHADEKWTRDVYVRLATAAAHTSRIGLGITVTDPYTRHPALTAQATATLAEASGGRLRVYLGAGSHFETLPGYAVDRPAIGIRETIELARRLWSGERVTLKGKVVRFLNGKLDFPVDPELAPSLWVAGRGKLVLRMAGEVADGVLIGSFATRGGIDYAKGRIAAGLERSGRAWKDVGLASWIYVSLLDDEDEEVPDNVRRGVSHALWSSRPIVLEILDDLATDVTDELRSFLRDAPHEWSPEIMAELRRIIPRGLIDSLAVVGTPEQVAGRLAALADLGIEECVIWPFTREGEDVEDFISRFAVEVMPRVLGKGSRGAYQLVD
ncbi:MAG: LLM class flavin-dependent oxidoreductase [Acidimicrobiia bacterium]|nr:LLM class flavin-dependent oxidoreductase [Acidimicrobiia bacterium]